MTHLTQKKKRMPSDTTLHFSTFWGLRVFFVFAQTLPVTSRYVELWGPLKKRVTTNPWFFSLKSRVKWPMTPVIHLFSAIYNWCLQHLPVESRPTNNHPGLRRLRRRCLIAQSLLKRLVQKTPLDPFGGWVSWSQKWWGLDCCKGFT